MLYLVSRKSAPRGRLLKLDPGVMDFTKAAVVVPESDAVILSGGQAGGDPIAVTPHALYLRELVGGGAVASGHLRPCRQASRCFAHTRRGNHGRGRALERRDGAVFHRDLSAPAVLRPL